MAVIVAVTVAVITPAVAPRGRPGRDGLPQALLGRRGQGEEARERAIGRSRRRRQLIAATHAGGAVTLQPPQQLRRRRRAIVAAEQQAVERDRFKRAHKPARLLQLGHGPHDHARRQRALGPHCEDRVSGRQAQLLLERDLESHGLLGRDGDVHIDLRSGHAPSSTRRRLVNAVEHGGELAPRLGRRAEGWRRRHTNGRRAAAAAAGLAAAAAGANPVQARAANPVQARF
eukprot:scaffold33099_cov61-Phaeocystis_antarctica.AAC.3